jgi:lipopolysaccharide biosynthesis glycosyltransferase
MIENISITQKINKDSFYIPSNSEYFNIWTKIFILSSKKYVPWIHIHCHIFDITDEDKKWLNEHNVSFTYENTPTEYRTLEEKKGYWVNVRFCRVPEIFEDSVKVMCLDSDSVVVTDISEKEFNKDTKKDWIVVRDKGEGCIGSCVVFAKNSPVRHVVRNRLLTEANTKGFIWYLDQDTFDKLIEENIIDTFEMKYSDFRCREENKIWTGKGNRKFKKKNKKRRFADVVEEYKDKV